MWAPASLHNPSSASLYWLRGIRYVVRQRPFLGRFAECFPSWFLRGFCAAGNISRGDCEKALTAHVSVRMPTQRSLDKGSQRVRTNQQA